MALVKTKGTALKQSISSVYVTVAQIVSMDGPDMKTVEFEANTLDNTSSGIPYEPTGDTEGGSLSGELFFDPALAGHKAFLALLTTPVKTNFKQVFADGTEWPFVGAGYSFKTGVSLKEGLKGSFSIKLSGIPTFPA